MEFKMIFCECKRRSVIMVGGIEQDFGYMFDI